MWLLPVPLLPVMRRSSWRRTKSRRASSRTSGLVELGLEVPVEGLEGLALVEAAAVDAPLDALLELVRRPRRRGRARAARSAPGRSSRAPRRGARRVVERVGQSEELEVSSESLEDEVVVGGGAARVAACVRLGMACLLGVCGADARGRATAGGRTRRGRAARCARAPSVSLEPSARSPRRRTRRACAAAARAARMRSTARCSRAPKARGVAERGVDVGGVVALAQEQDLARVVAPTRGGPALLEAGRRRRRARPCSSKATRELVEIDGALALAAAGGGRRDRACRPAPRGASSWRAMQREVGGVDEELVLGDAHRQDVGDVLVGHGVAVAVPGDEAVDVADAVDDARGVVGVARQRHAGARCSSAKSSSARASLRARRRRSTMVSSQCGELGAHVVEVAEAAAVEEASARTPRSSARRGACRWGGRGGTARGRNS